MKYVMTKQAYEWRWMNKYQCDITDIGKVYTIRKEAETGVWLETDSNPAHDLYMPYEALELMRETP